MKNEFFQKVLACTVLIASFAFITLVFFDLKKGLGLFVGALWGTANLYFLKMLIESLVFKQISKSVLLLCVKWPLLYFIGFSIIKTKWLPLSFLLTGFSLVFTVMLLLGFKENRLKT